MLWSVRQLRDMHKCHSIILAYFVLVYDTDINTTERNNPHPNHVIT